jgi:glutamate-1-semialdehyde 2,1-aminomutase
MRTFHNSETQLKCAEAVIPLGTQTFSKSRTQYPVGVSPLFLNRGEGSHVWDIDGNEYVDFVSSQCSITLGYCRPEIDEAVRAQLDSGVILSLPHELEAEVAERICAMVPCAEMVRFGKNGSDATSGCIRIARAHTGRDHVAVCGYHGWQDWYIGSTARNLGVPKATSDLTHPFLYNDLASLEKLFVEYPGQIAAVILEPMNVEWPNPGFLEGVREICTLEGAVLVFDETITGFRYANGGAQQLFGVTPDLASFGKGIANGYPVSAVTGRRDIMMQMEEVFFSFTFGGELLSLAAANATLQLLESRPILAEVEATGQQVIGRLKALIAEHQLEHVFSVKGHPSWSFLITADQPNANAYQIKTLMMQEFHQCGILCYGTHNISHSHSADDVDALMAAYGVFLPQVRDALAKGDILSRLRCDPLVPLFKIR